MKSVIAVAMIVLFAMAAASAQETKPKTEIPVLTAKEQLDLRNLQVEQMKAQQAYQAAIQQLPEYTTAQEATKKLRDAVQEMQNAHKVDPNKVKLCDGPAPGLCSEVKVGELVFREVPVQQAKK